VQPLGGELDGGEGVLDLVGQAPGDLGPQAAVRWAAMRRVMSSKTTTQPPPVLVGQAGAVEQQGLGAAVGVGESRAGGSSRARGGSAFEQRVAKAPWACQSARRVCS
jgi:hypothetical protein